MPVAGARSPVVGTARALSEGFPMGDVIRIGTETSGDPAYACQHVAAWWPLFKAIVKQDLNLDLEIIQALGSASTSAGTHGPPGTALDLRSWKFTQAQTLALVARARKYGAPATWLRTKAQGFDPHVHLVLDCPCISPADYQITAVKQGYNGLGSGGRGGTDTHPKTDVWRTHAQGIALMEADMALSAADKTWLEGLVTRATDPEKVKTSMLGASGPTVAVALQDGYWATKGTQNAVAALNGQLEGLKVALSTLAGAGLDLAAVEAAAKRGVELGLKNASVVIGYPKEQDV